MTSTTIKISSFPNNERGSITVFGLLLILMASLLFISYVNNKKYQHLYLQKNLKQILCVKEANGLLKKSIKQINTLNYIIALMSGVSIILPPITKPYLELGKKGAILFQNIIILNSKKNFVTLFNNSSCLLYKKIFTLPYKFHTPFKVARNFIGITKIKRYKWKKDIVIGKIKFVTSYEIYSAFDLGLEISAKQKKAIIPGIF